MSNNEEAMKIDLNKECRCLFCGGKFTARQIEFCVEITEMEEYFDQVFEDNIRKYKGGENIEAPYRIWIDWNDDPANILNEEDGIPYAVRGPLRGVTNSQASDFGFSMSSLYGTQEEEEEEEETSDDKIWRRSSIRVCPLCHMTLPLGFMSDKKIQVGLIGGQRSGKTTYLVVATKYMQQRLQGMGNGIGLGTVSLVPECERVIDSIYENGVAPTVATEGQEEDPPVLPIIMHITPSDKKYAPFCLILQDIPGEYMKPEPKYREMLSASNIRESSDLIMLIDINHFIETRQRKEKDGESDKYGEYCKMDVNRLFENIENLGMCLNSEQLKSVQITLTKLDFWKEEDERINMTAFGQSGDIRHKGAISESRLKQVSRQVEAVLDQMSDYGNMINVFIDRLNIKGPSLKTAYTAVASKTVPEHETEFKSGTDVNYSFSMNVLEPLLNVFSFHDVFPVNKEKKAIVEKKKK